MLALLKVSQHKIYDQLRDIELIYRYRMKSNVIVQGWRGINTHNWENNSIAALQKQDLLQW